jgi:hypothetical protein
MTIVNGQLADADEVLQICKIEEVYTGSDFDTTATGTTSASHELTAIAASKLINANYLIIRITYNSTLEILDGGSSGTASSTLKIETKDVGGSYSDSMATKTLITSNDDTGRELCFDANLQTVEWVHTLTNDEKTNGVQVKITSTSTRTNDNDATFSNVQTIVRVVN